MTEQELLVLKNELEALKQDNAKLKLASANNQTTGIKVSLKGAVSFYGLGRWPVTLYKSQWIKLFTKVDEIKAFMIANDKLLTEKPVK